jgi:transcriptional regulator with XRE-family HTH domain
MKRTQRKTPAERVADARLGALIRRGRQILGIGLLELGAEVGLSEASISREERGFYPWPEDAARDAVLFLIQRLVEKFEVEPPRGPLPPDKARRVLRLLVAEAEARNLGATVGPEGALAGWG